MTGCCATPSCQLTPLTWRGVHEQNNLPVNDDPYYQSAFKAIIGVFEACTSSLADVRRGICMIAECSGVGYNNVRPLSPLCAASFPR